MPGIMVAIGLKFFGSVKGARPPRPRPGCRAGGEGGGVWTVRQPSPTSAEVWRSPYRAERRGPTSHAHAWCAPDSTCDRRLPWDAYAYPHPVRLPTMLYWRRPRTRRPYFRVCLHMSPGPRRGCRLPSEGGNLCARVGAGSACQSQVNGVRMLLDASPMQTGAIRAEQAGSHRAGAPRVRTWASRMAASPLINVLRGYPEVPVRRRARAPLPHCRPARFRPGRCGWPRHRCPDGPPR